MIPPLTPELTQPRTKEDYKKLSRLPLVNHLKTEQAKMRPEHKILDFITKRIWTWIYYYLKSRFTPNHAYPAYGEGQTGVFTLTSAAVDGKGSSTIALVADWATDTAESCNIAQKIADHKPDYTIHMGDTYFVGAPHEIANNFLVDGSPWVRGSSGSFALLGNHEMYAQGSSFFDDLIQTLGIKDAVTGKYSGQQAGFFCLENDYWQIFGLDTGYHSIGKIPIIELIFQPDCHFDDILVDWLKKTLPVNSKKGLLIITHHQYISAFKEEREYQKPASQLASIIGISKPVLWLWGHEHKFSAFEKCQFEDGVTAYGRCIGHGGMPVELKGKSFELNDKTKGCSKLVMVDNRQRSGTDDYPLGHNGYALIEIKNEELQIRYYDEENLLLTENWNCTEGIIKGVSVTAEASFKDALDPDIDWNRMIDQ